MVDTKIVLLVGRSGRGKSAIANVITSTNNFKESAASASETRKIQSERLEDQENNINYLIIDTPGIGDTKLKENEVLDIIAEAVYLAKDGISQVFFTTNGRFDQFEMATYDLLRTIIFDNEITKHTTIVRTCFEDFRKPNKCEEDIALMTKESQDKKTELEKKIISKEKEKEVYNSGEKYQKILKEIEQLKKELTVTSLAEIVESCQRKVVHVDNPSLEIKGAREAEKKIREKRRERSRKILLEHLNKNCQEESYKPSKLQDLSNEIADDYFDYLEKKKELQKELEKLRVKEIRANSSQSYDFKDSNSNTFIDETKKQKLSTEATNSTGIIGIKERTIKLESKKERLIKEIGEKEKVIRQKVLKHIFNNYDGIAKELGGDIFLDNVIGNNSYNNWLEISKGFNKELILKWLSRGFVCERVREWATVLGNSFDPKNDVGFIAWLRDEKQLTVEKVKVNYTKSIKQLRNEYVSWLEKESFIYDQYNQQMDSVEKPKNPAQEWIDKNYPKEKRSEVTELNISGKNLVGDLDLSDFSYA